MRYPLLRNLPGWLALVLCGPLAWAGEASGQPDSGANPPSLSQHAGAADMSGQLLQLLLGLLLVLGLIFLLAWLTRRVQQRLPGGHGNDTIQLVATRTLGPRERLLLVQVGSEQILLGLTPGNIEALHVLQEPVTAPAREVATVGEFARRLKQALHQAGPDTDKDTR